MKYIYSIGFLIFSLVVFSQDQEEKYIELEYTQQYQTKTLFVTSGTTLSDEHHQIQVTLHTPKIEPHPQKAVQQKYTDGTTEEKETYTHKKILKTQLPSSSSIKKMFRVPPPIGSALYLRNSNGVSGVPSTSHFQYKNCATQQQGCTFICLLGIYSLPIVEDSHVLTIQYADNFLVRGPPSLFTA